MLAPFTSRNAKTTADDPCQVMHRHAARAAPIAGFQGSPPSEPSRSTRSPPVCQHDHDIAIIVLTRAGRRKLDVAAATTVFGIAELLEEILLGLPTKDLLLAQSVSRTWKAAISNSIRIQHALFLRPISIDTRSQGDITQSGSAGSSEPSVLFNPILPIVHTSGHRKCETTVENITAPDSSVGKMLLSQPAVTSIELFSHYYRPETEGKMYKPLVQSLIHNPEGVRMQDVYDQLVNDVRARTYCTGAILFFMRQNAHYKSLEWEPLEDTRQLEALKARLKK
ncbi:hypothetical protein CLAFUW4_09275 [Fulvia fulva]|uniref:F-box domain-containing protein n=1 Tax=Passalora fulva TaxID=5499 RepID=A0A9Q8UU06_PASFU|nr:uncharacterized protein CLAFUR5_09376 [Fulvia fulva]KAK4613423.1 hypothetical protein CLAFUR4_09281 [Fulvia fulva]KAK4614955.1 hypothetical protein CLAFUR0_09273 [Fulvia fulva]UJO22390.1 hypothetical protein CLAFUR5_09376 [Fulvia fulva]WPV20274.1 hypothetical protein CLAFUW4_09275 [Fulvia fulva]WPV34892.1 hypothetical protein CLAFUW7_09276 [Fulvia fulva]